MIFNTSGLSLLIEQAVSPLIASLFLVSLKKHKRFNPVNSHVLRASTSRLLGAH